MKQKHILFIVENNPFPNDIRVWHEAQAARDFGFKVSVICPKGGSDSRREIDGIRIFRHPMLHEGKGVLGLFLEYSSAFFWEFLLTLRVYALAPFHCIHIANPPDHLFLIALPYKLLSVKLIFDHHDITPENFVAKFGRKGFFYQALLVSERMTFKVADVVISTNESYRKLALTRGGKSPEQVFVVRNGPDADIMRQARPNQQLRDGFQFLVGYVGVIGQQEGIENLLKVVEYIVSKKNRTDIKFYVVGRGPHWEMVVRLSQQMGLSKYVHFTGYIPDQDLHELLNTVDVCVNPEYGNEFTDKSTMVKIMDYMTFGKPIVQFYTTEGEVTAGEAACYVGANSQTAFAESLLELLADEERRLTMGKVGMQRIDSELGWPRQKLRLKNAYAKVFGLPA